MFLAFPINGDKENPVALDRLGDNDGPSMINKAQLL
jgi:hypothetical protein